MSEAEARELSSVLGVHLQPFRKLSRKTPASLLDIGEIHIPETERDFWSHLFGARKRRPRLADKLESRVFEREDFEEVWDFLAAAPSESSLEALTYLHFLADGARVSYDNPGRYGFLAAKIVNRDEETINHCRFPVLAWKGVLLFPQLTLSRTRRIRPDFLVAYQIGRGVDWALLEIDGEGHQADHSRDEFLLLVLRAQPGQVHSDLPGWLDEQLGRLRDR